MPRHERQRTPAEKAALMETSALVVAIVDDMLDDHSAESAMRSWRRDEIAAIRDELDARIPRTRT